MWHLKIYISLNAFVFEWLSIEIALLSGNILIPIIIHFLFDFETKIIVMDEATLEITKGLRGALILILAFILRSKNADCK